MQDAIDYAEFNSAAHLSLLNLIAGPFLNIRPLLTSQTKFSEGFTCHVSVLK